MDPERQWIARLESETPQESEGELEAPLSRIPSLVGGGIVAACGVLELIGFLDEDLAILRPAAFAVAGLIALIVTLIEWRSNRAAREALRRSAGS